MSFAHRSRRKLGASVTALLCLAACAPTEAAKRALLVGVGHYQASANDLPGIAIDLDIMRDIAANLGYAPTEIRTLLDGEATQDQVAAVFKSWLIDGTRPGDEVLFYFSGHGSQVRDTSSDEADGSDEVLVTHDVQPDPKGIGLKNVVLDDQIADWLKALKGRKTMLLVDACHSGTATKSGVFAATVPSGELVPKFLRYDGMPRAAGDAVVSKGATGEGYVAIAAAADNEESTASSAGSLFTLGLREGVLAAQRERRALTPADLHQAAADFVAEQVKGRGRSFHPQLTGDQTLASAPLTSTGSSAAAGKRLWDKLESIVDASAQTLTVTVPGAADGVPRVPAGSALKLSVQVPGAGYLNVLAVGPDDTADILFPNKYHSDNRVSPGAFQFPTAEMNFDIGVKNLPGKNLVIALLTPEPLNLYESAVGQRDSKGAMTEDFGLLSALGLYSVRSSLTPVARPAAGGNAGKWAGKLILDVVPK